MLDPKIKRFLANIGKKGGKNTAKNHDMKEIGRLGGLKKHENARKKMTANELVLDDKRIQKKELSTDEKEI